MTSILSSSSSPAAPSVQTGLHPDIPNGVPLLLKASCDERLKRIRFAPDLQHLCFAEFQRKVAHALQFDDVDFAVTWQDDDGEHCEITNNDDLREALHYFTPSTASSAAANAASSSSSSGADAVITPITMRVSVRVETAVSLSDFGSSVWGGSDESLDVDGWNGSAAGGSERSLYPSAARLSSASSSSSQSKIRRAPCVTVPAKAPPSVASSRSPWNFALHAGQKSKTNGAGTATELDSLRSLSLISSPSTSRSPTRGSDADSDDSDDSIHTRAPRIRKGAVGRPKEAPNGFNVHVGIRCKTCRMDPIVGVRYHCASCAKGADFCGECEHSGIAVRKSPDHTDSHLMIKLAIPVQGEDVVEVIGRMLGLTTKRLGEQASSSSSSSDTTSAVSRSTSMSSTSARLPNHGSPIGALAAAAVAAIKCSFCKTPIAGARYLCANCPITGEQSHDGYNLCSSCEVHSLRFHDTTHFFIKLASIASLPADIAAERLPLGDRWDVQELTKGGPLLPCLYAELEPFDAFTPPTAARNGNRNGQVNQSIRIGDSVRMESNDGEECISLGNGAIEFRRNQSGPPTIGFGRWRPSWCAPSEDQRQIELQRLQQSRSRHIVPLNQLVHPSILCDSCFQVIHGAWFRCCHCTTSYDLCGTCMSRIAHDSTHAFAVFKQPVDLDLFKSCVDHQDAGDTPGASRAMLPFPLT